jgi:hypothetical protein
MGGVVKAIANVVSDVVEVVGDVADVVVSAAEDVVDMVAENPLLIVAAVAAPYALSSLAAEAAVAEFGTGAIGFVPEASAAVQAGTAVLEATGSTVAVASAEATAAEAAIASGASLDAATTAASLVSEGATVSEALTTATAGEAAISPLTEIASNASNAWETLSDAAKNLTKTIGETLLPDVSPEIQRLVGQTAINTVVNKGDFGAAVESTLLSAGTGALGSEIASETGSKLAGQIASGAANQLIRTGDLNPEGLAAGALGSVVGGEVKDLTDSDLAGRAASSLTSSVVQGRDPTAGLVNTAVGAGVNAGREALGDIFSTADATPNRPVGEDGPPPPADVSPTPPPGGLTQVASQDVTPPTGGLAQVAAQQPPEQLMPSATPPAEKTEEEKLADATKVASTGTATTAVPTSNSVAEQLAGKVTPLITSSIARPITSALTKTPAMPTRRTAPLALIQRIAAAQKLAASKGAPAQADVSQLTPVEQTAPTISAPRKVDVSTLSPIASASGLSSILQKLRQG